MTIYVTKIMVIENCFCYDEDRIQNVLECSVGIKLENKYEQGRVFLYEDGLIELDLSDDSITRWDLILKKLFELAPQDKSFFHVGSGNICGQCTEFYAINGNWFEILDQKPLMGETP